MTEIGTRTARGAPDRDFRFCRVARAPADERVSSRLLRRRSARGRVAVVASGGRANVTSLGVIYRRTKKFVGGRSRPGTVVNYRLTTGASIYD